MIPFILIGAAYLIGKTMKEESYSNGGEVPLLAPNGKLSNLTPEQWHLVRTPEFKAWFGDWENDAENASKVIDAETKEPLVCYHGSNYEFNKFNKGNIFFSPQKIELEHYGSIIRCFFLNIKNLKRLSQEKWTFFKKGKRIEISDDYVSFKNDSIITEFQNYIEQSHTENEGVLLKTYSTTKNELFIQLVVHEPTQIKLADGTNTTFDSSNIDIRYEEGGEMQNNNTYFVVRDTSHPNEDLQRNWSTFACGSSYGELSNSGWGSEVEAIKAYENYTQENCDKNFKFHPAYNSFVEVHYDGLGAWALDAENIDEAIEEAKNYEQGLACTMEAGNGHFFAEDVVSFHKVRNDRYVFEIRSKYNEGGKLSSLKSLEELDYELRYPKENKLLFLDADKLLKRHSIDNPSFDITVKDSKIICLKN
jgi:hypothetical protein